MNWYIQGDAAKAEQIKAAFEKEGYDVTGFDMCNDNILFFTYELEGGGKVISTTNVNLYTANIIKTHPDYKELELSVEPKFKAGDWIVQNDNGTVSQITKVIKDIDEDGEYRAYEHTNGYFAAFFENKFHLWTIADAKDGDVLTTKIDGDSYIVIYKQNRKDGWVETSGHYYDAVDRFCVATQLFCRSYQGIFQPATKEQRDLLFAKMKEAGYEWDVDKKELKKIKPHYDISNFKPFDKVLIRDSDNTEWRCNFFSHYDVAGMFQFFTIKCGYSQCIPYEGNEHLLGTTDMCDEQFINW